MFRLFLSALWIPFVSISSMLATPAAASASDLVLSGETGGIVSLPEDKKSLHIEHFKQGAAWSPSMAKGRVQLIVYVDPDERDLNNHVTDALAQKSYSAADFLSIAVINMTATWLPNFSIRMKIRASQESQPRTVYVEDKAKKLIKAWGLKDDSYCFVVLRRDLSRAFSKCGLYTEADTKQLLASIDAAIALKKIN